MTKEISMNSRKKIERIQKEFTDKFNYLTLIFLDENMKSIDVSRSLAEVRTAKGPDISIMGSLKVSTIEQRFKDSFGITVKVAYYRDRKVMHTKESVKKSLNELNQWCEKNGCDKFLFKKAITRNTLLSIQGQLFNAIKKSYPDADAKKINRGNFMGIHIPSIHSNRGSYLFFNTAKNEIKLGYYVRDEDFISKIIGKAYNIERNAYSLRISGNPRFLNVEEAYKAAIQFLSEFSAVEVADGADMSTDNEMQEFHEELEIDGSGSDNDSHEAKNGLEIEDFQFIHTLVILYSAFASQSGISDSSLDVLYDQLKLWDLGITDDEKNKEIMRAFKWFTNNYDASLFPRLKRKLNELTTLDEKKRKLIIDDLRLISATLFNLSASKIQLFSSIVTNLRFEVNEYGIEPVTKKMIAEFNNQFDIEYKSDCLLNFRHEGSIVLLSIDIRDLKRAIEENDFSEAFLHHIGKADLGDWESIQKLTNEKEAETLKKDFKGVKPDYIVIMYCQGNYIHAFSSD